MTSLVIHTQALHKHFGSTHALNELDLEVEQGEVHGFLGPNGAGKSTAIRVLLGLLRADSGQASLLGGDPWREATALHRRLAYVPGDVALWPQLTGGQAIDLLGKLRGGLNPQRREALVERFHLDVRKKGRAYSKGNRQKVAIVAALASDVELLILDEPTSGLDPLMEAVFKEEIRAANQRGTTVLLSSHILAEVETLCYRVSIIREGHIVQRGTLAQLRHLTRLQVSATLRQSPPEGLAQLAGVHGLTTQEPTPAQRALGGQYQVRFGVDALALEQAMQLLAPLGILDLTCSPPSLEELFLQHYSTPKQPQAPASQVQL